MGSGDECHFLLTPAESEKPVGHGMITTIQTTELRIRSASLHVIDCPNSPTSVEDGTSPESTPTDTNNLKSTPPPCKLEPVPPLYKRNPVRRGIQSMQMLSETEKWGYILLVLTWLVFVVGMGEILGIWRWSLKNRNISLDTNMPIPGYYVSLTLLSAGVVVWVWVLVRLYSFNFILFNLGSFSRLIFLQTNWTGLKLFRHN